MTMKLSYRLFDAVAGGICQIGQVAILPPERTFDLCHIDDLKSGSLLCRGPIDDIFEDPAAARDIATWTKDGRYRFNKSEQSLKRGWLLSLSSREEVLQALDLFYPAAVGMWFAQQDGRLEVEHLRDKLNRQTGMYRFARTLSDAGAQRLVREIYGPANACAQKILWQIDADTPLEDSEASRYNGIVDGVDDGMTIPLLSREPSNHLVAEARKAAKAEFDAKAKAAE